MPLPTHGKQMTQTYSSQLDSAKPLIIQEHTIINDQTATDTEYTKHPSYLETSRQYGIQKVEEGQNVQLLEPSLHEQLSVLESPETEIINKIKNVSFQEDVIGVKIPLDIGTPSLHHEKV